jgi:hybrid cluster-associated redox disulfide protein
MKKNKKITGKMTVEEVMRNFPGTSVIFAKYGLQCVGCPMALPETIEEAASVHGLDVKKFIKELNEAAGQ